MGRALLPELASRYRVRSVHRHPVPRERQYGVEWIQADVAEVSDWGRMLEGVDAVVNLAWFRWAREGQFRTLRNGTLRLIAAARSGGVRRFVQVSVPPAPAELEQTLPYLRYRRQVDRAIEGSGLSYRILAPTMLFGPGDRLLGVMLRLMARYHRFPMFGDGEYHLSPIAVTDLAEAVLVGLSSDSRDTQLLGGPDRFEYRALTDLLFRLLGLPPRYSKLTVDGGIRLTRVLRLFGSKLLYPYEVEWLTSDLLGLPPYEGLGRPLTPVGPYLRAEAARYTPGRPAP